MVIKRPFFTGSFDMELRIQNLPMDPSLRMETDLCLADTRQSGRRSLKDWTLSPHSFDLLLNTLDPDRDRAGEEYERLRRTLVTFFDWRGCISPEDLADETFNRAARRLEEGEPIRSLADYCHGVARRLVFEAIPRQNKTQEPPDEFKHLAQPEQSLDERLQREARFESFERCLGKLPPDDRNLVITYYQTERRAKIDNRVALAQSLGISLNNLRVRVYRIRAKLEGCMKICAD
jgi:RNA polymerase sigma factor (sigma-70 family)